MSGAFEFPPARGWSRARVLVAIGWTAIVLTMLWIPTPPPPPIVIPYFDKYVHFAFFFGIGLAWRFAHLRRAWVLGGGVVLGALTEVVQGSLPWPRSADALDVLADLAGLLVAVLAFWVWHLIGRRLQASLRRRSLSPRDVPERWPSG